MLEVEPVSNLRGKEGRGVRVVKEENGVRSGNRGGPPHCHWRWSHCQTWEIRGEGGYGGNRGEGVWGEKDGGSFPFLIF